MSFTFTLEHEDGSPAEPPALATAVPNWNVGPRRRTPSQSAFS